MYYDPVMCMMVPGGKTKDELSLAQKKQVVTELKGFLKKSYNFSDEREYARAYEDLRHMFTTGSRKSISGLFENAVKKTGSHDSVETKDAEFQMFGPEFHHPIIKANSKEEAIKKAKQIYGWGGKVEAVKVSDEKTIDKAIRSCDANNKFAKGDLVKYYNSIYKIISYNEKDNTYSLVSIPGSGSRMIADRIDKEGKKISKIPKGIFTDQWGSKWEVTYGGKDNWSAKSIKSGEKKTFNDDWILRGGRLEWK